MPQIRLYNKQTGVTYVYESENYYDPVKKQGRSRRKLIGKIDPATGDIVPTGKPGRAPKTKVASEHSEADYEDLQARYEEIQAKLESALKDLAEKEKARAALDQEVRALKKDFREYKKLVRRIVSELNVSQDSSHPETEDPEEE